MTSAPPARFLPERNVQRLVTRLEASRRSFLEVENEIVLAQNDPLRPLVDIVGEKEEERYGQRYSALFCLADPAKLRTGTMFERVVQLAEKTGDGKIKQPQRQAIKSHVGQFASLTARDGSKDLIEVSVVDFGYGTKFVAPALAMGKDSFQKGFESRPEPGTSVRLRTHSGLDRPMIKFDPRAWLVACGDQKMANGRTTKLSLADAHRNTEWFGKSLSSYEQRLRLSDLDEAKEVEAAWFVMEKIDTGVPISLGSKEVRIRCVRYELDRFFGETVVRVHRFEIILLPGDHDFALHHVIVRSSPLICYLETLPGVRGMLAKAS